MSNPRSHLNPSLALNLNLNFKKIHAMDEIYIPYLAPPRKSKTKPSPPNFQIRRHSKCFTVRNSKLSEWSWERRYLWIIFTGGPHKEPPVKRPISTGGSLSGPPVEMASISTGGPLKEPPVEMGLHRRSVPARGLSHFLRRFFL